MTNAISVVIQTMKNAMTKMNNVETTKMTNDSTATQTTTNAAKPRQHVETVTPEQLVAVKRVATMLVGPSCNPFDVSFLRWGLARIGSAAVHDPIRFAASLIDETLAQYDATSGRYAIAPPAVPICYDACSPVAGCVGDFGYGVTIRHAPASGHWIVDGVTYPSDRRAAERAARKLAALRKLAAELGIEVCEVR